MGSIISVLGVVLLSLFSVVNNFAAKDVIYLPVEDFFEDIDLKPFGLYVTPSDSPVSPERFRGYHTGVDVELSDSDEDVPVFAVADGVVKVARTANGYGGVVVVVSEIDGELFSLLYGHVDIDSVTFKVGEEIKAGDQLAVLGEGYSDETDGERPHLHFSVKRGEDLDLRGYVQSEQELNEWIDPLLFLQMKGAF